jgi:hypothetical protein
MMQTWKQARFTFSVVALAILSPVSFAQVGDHGSSEKLGTVNFSTSCSSAAQPQFNRAVALMHSFQFANAIEAFRAILAGDPSCSMVYWGIALSDWGNPFASGLKSQAQLDAGLKAVEQGRRSPPKSERERAYLEAVARLYTDTATVDQRSRKVAYENAMAAVSATYPEDMEAAIFYALAVSAAADPGDKTYARQLKAGEILDRLYVEYPNHPGLAHYIIHTYDVPPLATRAAGAAQHYSEIAPSTPHALHMPSHTFTRVGDWQASIDANVASAAAARSAGQPADEWHASDYLEYAYLQMAQDNASKGVVESADQIFLRFDPKMQIGGAAGPAAAYFARAAIPARYDLERRDWAHAAKLQPLPSPFPYTEAMTYFGRGLGAAHLKDTTGARAAIDSLARCRDRLNTMKEDFWANQVEIQRLEVVAWLAFSQGRSENALAGMRRAAELEDATEKSVITPGPLAPARELLGELLLESKRPAEALVEFESTLKREPNRFWSLYGAAEAAKANGDQQKTKQYFSRLVKVADRADQPGRRELVQARSSLSDQD